MTVTPQAMHAAPPARTSLSPSAITIPQTAKATIPPRILMSQPPPVTRFMDQRSPASAESLLLLDSFHLRHRAPVFVGGVGAGIDRLLEVSFRGRLVFRDHLLDARIEVGVAGLVLVAD